jgi:hypothetical protein
MQLPDVNVLVSAFRDDAPDHGCCRLWVETTVASDESFGMSDLVLSGFLRVVTHPRIFALPSPVPAAIEFAEALRAQPHCVPVHPGARHWDIFVRLCDAAEARGNLIPDAYLAAMAIESGCDWITLDRDYARFDGLRWRRPSR